MPTTNTEMGRTSRDVLPIFIWDADAGLVVYRGKAARLSLSQLSLIQSPLIEIEVQPLDDGLAANLAIPPRLPALGGIVAQMGNRGRGIGAEQ